MPLLLLGGASLIGGLIATGAEWFGSKTSSNSTVGGGAAGNSQMPWYVMPTVVVVGGFIAYKIISKKLHI